MTENKLIIARLISTLNTHTWNKGDSISVTGKSSSWKSTKFKNDIVALVFQSTGIKPIQVCGYPKVGAIIDL